MQHDNAKARETRGRVEFVQHSKLNNLILKKHAQFLFVSRTLHIPFNYRVSIPRYKTAIHATA